MFGQQKKLFGLLVLPFLLVACCQCPELPTAELSLDKGQALRSETVTATVEGLDTAEVEVSVAGLNADILDVQGSTVQFNVPEAPAGVQSVIVMGDTVARGELEVFGESVIDSQLTLLLQDSTPEAENELETLLPEGFSLIDINPNSEGRELRPLSENISEGPCGGQLALIDVGDTPLGEAIEVLKKLEEENEGLTFEIDPADEGGPSFTDPLGAVGARSAQTRGSGGAGTLIAVLDTGVNPHDELEGRIRFDLGLNLINEGSDPTDGFEEDSDNDITEGHGTAVAVLAAGETLGVAPQAQIIPIKVCGDEQGSCLSSNVIIGTCHALSKAKEEDKLGQLVLNYSLGSDTIIDAVEAIIDYALGENVLVAAAGGNDRQEGSPPKYPAAYDLPGLVAVAALQADTLTCVDFDALDVGAQYTLEDSSFTSNGVDLTVEALRDTAAGSSVTITNDSLTDGELGETAFNNARLRFDFAYPLDGLSLRYGDYGRAVELVTDTLSSTVDGIAGFEKLSDEALTINVIPDPDGDQVTGIMTLTGELESFSIGGEPGFYADNVCPLSSQAWTFADFSTKGGYIDIAAPGANISSGTPDNGLATYRGTSFATPIMAGALALWRETNPSMTPQEIEQALKNTAISLEELEENVGAGLLNLNDQP